MAIRSDRGYVDEASSYPGYVERDVPRTQAIPWSPAQFVGMIVGVGFAVLGIVALIRTGFDTSHIYTPRVIVWHLAHNPVLAASEIGFGVLMIFASVVPGGLRTLMALLGAAALVLGIVVLAGPSHRLVHWLGVGHSSGVFFTIVGAVVIVFAIISPVFFAGGERRFSRRV